MAQDDEVARATAAADLAQKLFDLAQARRRGYSDLLPDLSKATRGGTTLTGESTVSQSLLGGKALAAAAEQVRDRVQGALGQGDKRVVLTTDSGFAGRSAEHDALVTQLKELHKLLKGLEERLPDPSGGSGTEVVALGPLVLPAVTALSSALPGLLSYLTTTRTVQTGEQTADPWLTSAAVAGALTSAGIWTVLDGTQRPPSTSTAMTRWTEVDLLLSALADRVGAIEADPPPPELVRVKTVLEQYRRVLTAAVTIPDGGTISPVVASAMHEALTGVPALNAVVTVQGAAMSFTQLLNDRAVGADGLSVVCTATIGFLVVDARPTKDGRVRGGGVAVGTAQVHGRVGQTLRL